MHDNTFRNSQELPASSSVQTKGGHHGAKFQGEGLPAWHVSDMLISGHNTSDVSNGGHGHGDHGGMGSHGDHANPHEVGTSKHTEHEAFTSLVPMDAASHMALESGDWFDPTIWSNGEVPGPNAQVYIPQGVSVTYAGLSDTPLFTLRVDGALSFAHDANSRMVVDTFVVTQTGKLTIGTEDNPVSAAHSVDIQISGNGAIDATWDPMLLSRGLISHGEVEIHGAEKLTHSKVSEAPMAGDTSIAMSELPEGWQVGDTIVIAGTHYDGYKWDNDIREGRHYEAEDEVRTISKIDGSRVFFEEPLIHDHDSPRSDLATSVANYTRNVTFSSPDDVSIHERGHVMFMHSDSVDVRYAAFEGLGRTDKSKASTNVMDLDDVAADSNVQGRYSVHLHRTGAEDGENPALLVGNAVFGSPGWGFVHHDSNAILHENATFDTFGAGFVAESGNETGRWSDNIAIYAKGVSWAAPKNAVSLSPFDTGRTGDGFWFQGRMVESSGNIAASVNNGFVYFHRGSPLTFNATSFDFPEALGWDETTRPGKAPILHFVDNEAFAAKEGLHVVKANPNQRHGINSVLNDFTAWNVVEGAHFEYTSHYTIKNFDLIARESVPFKNSRNGISFGPNTSDMTIVNAQIEGFDNSGINLSKKFTSDLLPELHQYTVIDPSFVNVTNHYENYDPNLDSLLTAEDITPNAFELSLDSPLFYKEGWQDPQGRRVDITGTITDSLGKTSLIRGTDNYDASRQEVIHILENDGYFQTADGKNVFVLEDYFSDRASGDIHKVAYFVEINSNVALGNQYHGYANAKFNGILPEDNVAPVMSEAIELSTDFQEDILIDLLAFSSDPNGDPLRVDGLLQPLNGKVFVQDNGYALYRPDFDYFGTDTFEFWVTDGFGAFTKTSASITVRNPDITITGTPSGETLLGNELDNTIVGDAGDDVLSGLTGSDTYIFAPGYGMDQVDDENGENDVIEFLHVANIEDLSISRAVLPNSTWEGTLLLETALDEQVEVKNHFASHGRHRVETLRLSSGDSFTMHVDTIGDAQDDLLVGRSVIDYLKGRDGHDYLIAGGSNDVLFGCSGDDTLNGQTGNDHLRGGDGADRYILNAGDGQDLITEYDGIEDLISVDVIVFNDITDLSDLTFSRVAESGATSQGSLLIEVDGTSDSVRVQHHFASNDRYKIEQIELGDGTVYQVDELAIV